MPSPALLVVFVLTPARVDSSTPPFEQAAREVLGPSAELRLETVASLPPDAVALKRAGAADGVVEMSWTAEQDQAVLHCYIASEQRWVDRTIHFDAADRDPDRGRLLGFAAAAMFIGAPSFVRARAREQGIVGPVPIAPPGPVPVPTLPVAAPPSGAGAKDAPPSASLDMVPSKASPSRDRVSTAGTLEFAGVASGGVGTGASLELGALAALGVPLSESLSARVQLEGREGEIVPAQAVVRRVFAGVGLAWDALPEASHIELTIRADGLGSWFQVSHLSADDVASVKNHGWLFGADALATLGYRISTLLTLSAGVGFEAMLGQTHVFTHGVERATLPAFRGLAELGFVTHF